MEDGFTGRQTKGLFTFYREQGEQEARLGQMKSQLVKVDEGTRHYASAVAVNVRQEKNKERVSLLINHQINNKPSRYKQEDNGDRHQIYTSKHVFSLNFNSPRKNGYYMQIIAERNRRVKSELDESISKPISIKINRRCLIGQLSVRQMPSSIVKDLFQPKQEAASKAHTSRKKLQVDENGSHETLKSNRGENIFHVPIERFRRCKGKLQFKPTIAKDILQLRRHKLCSNGFWQQIKQKKPKHEGSISNINRKIQEWITINDMGKPENNHLPRISPEPAQ